MESMKCDGTVKTKTEQHYVQEAYFCQVRVTKGHDL